MFDEWHEGDHGVGQFRFPGYWSPGEPFDLFIRLAAPVTSTSALVALRGKTRTSLAELKAALQRAEVVLRLTLVEGNPTIAEDLARLRAVTDVLESEGGMVRTIIVGSLTEEIDEHALIVMLGRDSPLYRP